MDDQQHELNQVLSEATSAHSLNIAAIRTVITALLQVLHWKDPSLKAELSDVLDGLVRFLDEEGDDSEAAKKALEIVSDIR